MAGYLVIAAGGTGGHMFPAEALAREMLRRGWRVALATDARGLRYAGGFPEAVARLGFASASPSRGGIAGKLSAPFAILKGTMQARSAFRDDRPDVVAGFGGYPSMPALGAALALGLPRLIHEQNGVLGRVNRLFAARVDRVACGTWPVSRAPGSARLSHIGNPVRGEVLEAAQTPYPEMDGPLRLLVFGGSQGAGVFAEILPEALRRLPEALRARLTLTQQVRPEDMERTAASFAAAGIEADLAPFFTDMPARIAASHLVIARAGASTVAELGVIGRPAILIPYPHALDDHQTANARALAEAGGALVLPQDRAGPEEVADAIRSILETGRSAEMAEAAKSAGRPRATADLADLVEALGKARGG